MKSRKTYGNPPSAPVQISYRSDQGKRMHGAFFDHYVIRMISNHETEVLKSEESSISSFTSFIQSSTLALGINDAKGDRIIPSMATHNTDQQGLLFIPGCTRDNESAARSRFEQQIIKDAMHCGRPILAICAGSWQLWQAYGGKVREIKDHLYSSMPYILTGGRIGNNKQIHRIVIQHDSLTKALLNPKDLKALEADPSVNSVHWRAPDEKSVPEQLLVSAYSKADEDIAPNSRQSKKMEAEEKTIEAFESKHGAPTLGIQWHPESYYEKTLGNEEKRQLNIIQYMAKAGDSYRAKRVMLKEFEEKFKPSTSLVTQGLFKVKTATKALPIAEEKIISEEKKERGQVCL